MGLTTPQGNDHAQTEKFTARDDQGNLIFKNIRLGAPCDDCKKKSLLCVHLPSATPEGLSIKKRLALQHLYAKKKHVFDREFKGQIADDSLTLFNSEWLKVLLQKNRLPVCGPIDAIFVSIDPAQGGKCEWGLVATYYSIYEDAQVIIMLDAQRFSQTTPGACEYWLRTALLTIRNIHPLFADIPIIVACEAAPLIIATYLNHDISRLIETKQVINTYMMAETADGNAGVPKTAENTRQMVHYSRKLLERGRVYFSEVLATTTPNKSVNDMVLEFVEQVQNVRVRYPKGNESGRIDGKYGGKNDDLAVAWFMNFYWYIWYYISGKELYREIKAKSDPWRRKRYVGVEPFSIPLIERLTTAEDFPQVPERDINGVFLPPKRPRDTLTLV